MAAREPALFTHAWDAVSPTRTAQERKLSVGLRTRLNKEQEEEEEELLMKHENGPVED